MFSVLKDLWGSAPAIDILHFEHKKWKGLGSDIRPLFAGMFKARLASPASLIFSHYLIEYGDLGNIFAFNIGLPAGY